MTRPDLHAHTTASDGALSPLELAARAAEAGVTLLAITDHDTFDGADSLMGADTPIPVITGVELSIRDMKNLHLLGYGLAGECELRETVRRLSRQRETRGARMLEKLAALGLSVPAELLEYQGSLGRPHIARAMVKLGYVRGIQEAFDRYLEEGKPAYVPGERLSMAEALPLMRASGFVPVLAHPMELGKDETTLRALIAHWKDEGLMGVEAYHPSARPGRAAMLDRMARSMGLLVTGGSDFHQPNDSHAPLGSMTARWPHPQEDARRLLAAMEGARTRL